MASADYEETYVGENDGRNVEQRSYEEINEYENENNVIGVPPSTPAMPPPQLLRNPPQQNIEELHEMKKYELKWLTAAFVIVSVIFAGIFVAVFVMITTGREQGESHKKEVEKSNTRYDELLAKQGWAKLSNGLHYKYIFWNPVIAFATAEGNCKAKGGRLASTGIRNATIRRNMASADYEETYVNGNVRRNMEQLSYEEINAYENEERSIGGRGPTSTPAMPPPQLSRNPPQQDADKRHEMKKYGLKWLTAAFVIVSVIFAGMFVAVFVMITTDREQGGTRKKEAVAKINHETLDTDGWKKLSNGLHYKYFVQTLTYAAASDNCKNQRARLASTGIRDATIRSEVAANFAGSGTWIGLSQPYDNTTWVWSDGKSFEEADMPWESTTCTTETGQSGRIHLWSTSQAYIYCYDSTVRVYGHICEI